MVVAVATSCREISLDFQLLFWTESMTIRSVLFLSTLHLSL